MKRLISLFSVAVVALLVVSSCDRYEEGSNFSLITAKGRFSNTWTMSKITTESGGVTADVTSWYSTYTLTTNKDGSYTRVENIILETTETGTWTFNDDKTQVTMTDEDGDVIVATLIKLKNKELKFEYTNALGVRYTIEFTGA